ncbi:MAG: oligosaccharide flippase family protein [Anaerolineae bacterium]
MIRLRHLVKDTSVYGLVSATRSLVGLLLVPIYTRVFLPGDYGQIDTLTTLVAFLTLAATLGMDTAAALYFYDNAGPEDRGAMITTAVAARVGLSSLFSALVSLFAPAIAELLFHDPTAASAIRIAVWTAPANAMVGFLIELLRLSRKPWAYAGLAIANLLLGVGLSILFVVGWRWGVDGAFAGPLAAAVLVLPAGFWATRRLLFPHFSRAWLAKLLHIGLPLIPAALGGWFIAYSNRYFLLHYGSAADVGLLAVGNKASAPLVLFTSAFLMAWGPFAFSLQKQENAPLVYAKALTYFWIVAGTGAVLVALFAREMLLVFTTTGYLAGASVSGLMALQIVADASYYIVSIGAILAKRTRLLAVSVPLAAAACVAYNVLLVPRLTYIGAALAAMLAYGTSAVIAYFLSQRAYPIPYETRKVLGIVALCVGAWLAALAANRLDLWPGVGVKIALFAGFVAALFLLRIVGAEEVRLAVGWARRRLQRAGPESPPSTNGTRMHE